VCLCTICTIRVALTHIMYYGGPTPLPFHPANNVTHDLRQDGGDGGTPN